MTPADILLAINIINGLITLAKNAPGFITHAKAIVAEIQPHIDAAGDDVKKDFAAARDKLAAIPAPTGLQEPVPHSPRLAELVAQRTAAQKQAADAQGRAERAEALVQEHSAKVATLITERDQTAAHAVALSEKITQLTTAVVMAQGERDVARQALAQQQEARAKATATQSGAVAQAAPKASPTSRA
jgi:hypothetical protein